MLDETFVFLSKPHVGTANRKNNESTKQYCKIDEIINFVNDSINNNTLNKGVKYLFKDYTKYKYKFNKGSNKRSVSIIINTKDYSFYEEEIKVLNRNLRQNGLIKYNNLNKINVLLDNPLALLTYTREITINKIKKTL